MSPFSRNISMTLGRIELSQTFMTERFANKDNGFKPITIFAKRSILNIWQGSDDASESVFTNQ